MSGRNEDNAETEDDKCQSGFRTVPIAPTQHAQTDDLGAVGGQDSDVSDREVSDGWNVRTRESELVKTEKLDVTGSTTSNDQQWATSSTAQVLSVASDNGYDEGCDESKYHSIDFHSEEEVFKDVQSRKQEDVRNPSEYKPTIGSAVRHEQLLFSEIKSERQNIALLKWLEEDNNSRKATNPVPKRVLQRNKLYSTLKPAISQDQRTLLQYPLYSWEELIFGFKISSKAQRSENISQPDKKEAVAESTEKWSCDKIKNLPNQPINQKSQDVFLLTERKQCDKTSNLSHTTNTQKTPGLPIKTERKQFDEVKIPHYQPNTKKSQGLSTTTESKHCDGSKRLTTEKKMGPPVVVKSEIQKSQHTNKPDHPLVGSYRPHVYKNKIKRTQHAPKRTITEEQLRAMKQKDQRMKNFFSQQFGKTQNISKKSVTLAQTQGHTSGVAKFTKDTMSPSLVSRKRKASRSDILPQSKRSKVSKQEPGIVLRMGKDSSGWYVKQGPEPDRCVAATDDCAEDHQVSKPRHRTESKDPPYM